MNEQVEALAISNPNVAWVHDELGILIQEWKDWQAYVANIEDYPYDPNTQTDVFKDGEENMHKQNRLQAKTLTFLNNNISGHGFIKGFDGTHVDRKDLRLRIRVEHRIQELEVLSDALEYAKVPESFWKERAKDLLDKIADKGSDAAIEITKSYLKNPLSSKE